MAKPSYQWFSPWLALQAVSTPGALQVDFVLDDLPGVFLC